MARYLMLFFAMTFAACGTSNEYPSRAVMHLSSQTKWNSATTDAAAKADVIVLPMQRFFFPEGQAQLDRVVSLNPDVKFVGYVSVLAVGLMWPDTAYVEQQLPFEWEYYKVTRPYWAYTSTGDTLSIWPGQVMLNPIKDGQVNTVLISSIVRLVKKYSETCKIDGVFHDYLMTGVYRNPNYAGVNGATDFDGDGVPIEKDVEELRLLKQYQLQYLDSFRIVMGDEFIQIANGFPPQTDADYASRVNGILFERYPCQTGKYTPKKGTLNMIATQKGGWLRACRGRTWSILWSQGADSPMQPLVGSMLVGCFYAEGYLFNGWRFDFDAGKPKGYMTAVNDSSGALVLKREFEKGTARVKFYPNSEYISECVFDSTMTGAK